MSEEKLVVLDDDTRVGSDRDHRVAQAVCEIVQSIAAHGSGRHLKDILDAAEAPWQRRFLALLLDDDDDDYYENDESSIAPHEHAFATFWDSVVANVCTQLNYVLVPTDWSFLQQQQHHPTTPTTENDVTRKDHDEAEQKQARLARFATTWDTVKVWAVESSSSDDC